MNLHYCEMTNRIYYAKDVKNKSKSKKPFIVSYEKHRSRDRILKTATQTDP